MLVRNPVPVGVQDTRSDTAPNAFVEYLTLIVGVPVSVLMFALIRADPAPTM